MECTEFDAHLGDVSRLTRCGYHHTSIVNVAL